MFCTLFLVLIAGPGCGGGVGTGKGTPAPAMPKEPRVIASLDQLVPLPSLRWIVIARPKEITAVTWLEPSLEMIFSKERLDHAAQSVGFDLRTTSEAIWAEYRAEGGGEAPSLQLVRHANDPLTIERLFRDRLATDIVRSVDEPDVVRVSGHIGQTVHAFSAMGKDVVCLQQDGSAERGPCRIASLLALGKLKRTKYVFQDESLRTLAQRFASAPLVGLAPGPFDEDVARGMRGLLGAATAVGAAFRPTTKQSVLLEIALTGDFSTSGGEAAQKLMSSWEDVAARPLGHLLGLDTPLSPPLPTHTTDVVTLVVELDPRKLAKGLADATSNQIREIMQ